MEHFRTGNPPLHYSGYPGSSFPKQCGGGYGFGGHGQYGTYGSCAGSQVDANVIDYQSADACGGQMTAPDLPNCGPMKPLPPAKGPCTEGFASWCGCGCGCGGKCGGSCGCGGGCTCGTGGGSCGCEGFAGSVSGDCGRGVFWADETCRLPPNHCGGQACSQLGPQPVYGGCTGGLPALAAGPGGAMVENYVGDLGDAGRFAGDDAGSCGKCTPVVPDGCCAKAQKDPGYGGLMCQMPYSAPYQAGPNACVVSDDGHGHRSVLPPAVAVKGGPALPTLPALPALPALPPLPVLPAPQSQFSLTNVLIAVLVAFLVYKFLIKRR